MVALLHIRPYLFEREFQDLLDAPATDEADVHFSENTSDENDMPVEPEILAPVFSEDDLAAARAEGHAAGELAGRTAAEGSLNARCAQALEGLRAQLHDATAAASRTQAAILTDATTIALALCRKLLPHTYRHQAREEIAHLLATVLPRIADQTSLSIRLAPSLAVSLGETIHSVIDAAGFGGSVNIIEDGSLAEGDCRIEWSQGGIMRDVACLLYEIESVVEQTIGVKAADLKVMATDRESVDANTDTPAETDAGASAVSPSAQRGESNG